jgi:hypothetical protein
MRSWSRTIGLGIVAWLVPFIVAFAAFPFHDSARPLFESIMAVAVTGTAVVLGLVYLRRAPRTPPSEGLIVGVVWLVICVAIDAPLMLLGGPMKMSMGAYATDIALTYVSIPLVTWGLAAARAA